MENNHNCSQNISSHDHDHSCDSASGAVMSHFPYAVLSVAASLAAVALLDYFSFGATPATVQNGAHTLFHTFHFMHIVFAATGAMLTFFRFSRNIIKGVLVCGLSTVAFCVLSDILLPYLIGRLFGVPMHLHICFVSELQNVLPFLAVGMLNGWVLSQHRKQWHSTYSLWSHFMHIYVSSFAALLYTVSHGFTEWSQNMGMLFLLIIAAVVVPCTLSDVVIPLFFAKDKKC